MTAAFRLAAAFADHMVLQRDKPLTFWGTGDPGALVTLAWADAFVTHFETRVDAGGAWRLSIPARPAGGPYQLGFSCGEELTLRDVWVGEVWLASGQSNMEWTVAQSDFVEEELALATEPRLRWLYVERRPERDAGAEARCEWRLVTRESAWRMTAIGYAFGRRLVAELDVAVGIIDASWGGTPIESWLSPQALGEVMDLPAELAAWEREEADIDSVRRAHAAELRAWEIRCLVQDTGNRGEELGFHLPEPAWTEPTLDVPTLWQRHGMAFNGAVWFRRELVLPDDWTSPSVLQLGRIDDFDHTYVNGQLVGSYPQGTPQSCEISRRYDLPDGALRAGRNVIAVRVFDHVGEGGFLDPPGQMYLESATGQRIALAGPWQYRVERAVPLVPGSVWAEFPRAPRVLRPQDRPSALYLGMISPLLGTPMRGVIWYQGESNAAEHRHYRRRFGALITDFQRRIAAGDPAPVPFLFVQLASFSASEDWAWLREAQSQSRVLPHTGMVVTLDIGNPSNIHPGNKREVARRLALLALHDCYGRDVGPVRGPSPAAVRREGAHAVVDYLGASELRTVDGGSEVLGFELELASGEVERALARLANGRVQVALPTSGEPRYLRYAFRDVPPINLTCRSGLPAEPFRLPLPPLAQRGSP